MRNLLEVIRCWLVPTAGAIRASEVRASERIIVVNETGGFVYEVRPDRHLSADVDTRIDDLGMSEPASLAAPTKELDRAKGGSRATK
jgi:hypothetical protein